MGMLDKIRKALDEHEDAIDGILKHYPPVTATGEDPDRLVSLHGEPHPLRPLVDLAAALAHIFSPDGQAVLVGLSRARIDSLVREERRRGVPFCEQREAALRAMSAGAGQIRTPTEPIILAAAEALTVYESTRPAYGFREPIKRARGHAQAIHSLAFRLDGEGYVDIAIARYERARSQ